MKYAIIQAGGSQHKVSEGDELLLLRLEGEPKKKLAFDQVLLVVDETTVKLGTPTVAGASIQAELMDHEKGKKIRVATYKAKSRYRRVKGHRDHLTRVRVLRIVTREKETQRKTVTKEKKIMSKK